MASVREIESRLILKPKRTRTREVRPSHFACTCSSEEHQVELDDYLDSVPIYPRGSGNLWGNASHSDYIISKVTTVQSNGLFSPGERTRKRLREETVHKTPANTRVINTSENGSAIRIETPDGKTHYDRSFKVTLTFNKGQANEEKVKVELFQTRTSAEKNHKEIKITPEGLAKVAQRDLTIDSNRLQLERLPHTSKSLNKAAESKHKISPQHKGLRATDIAAYYGFQVRSNHGHGHAHRHGQRPMFPAGADTLDESKGLITTAGPEKHNYMRLVSAEITDIADYVEYLGKLFYSVYIDLYQDENGKGIPIPKKETASWEDENGNEITFHYDPHNGVTPAIELEQISRALYEVAFGANRSLVDEFDEVQESDNTPPLAKKPRLA